MIAQHFGIIFWMLFGIATTVTSTVLEVRKRAADKRTKQLHQRNKELVLENRAAVRDLAKANAERLRLREKKFDQFEAYQECPKCEVFDFHFIEDVWFGTGHRSCIRRCNSCGHGWYQR